MCLGCAKCDQRLTPATDIVTLLPTSQETHYPQPQSLASGWSLSFEPRALIGWEGYYNPEWPLPPTQTSHWDVNCNRIIITKKLTFNNWGLLSPPSKIYKMKKITSSSNLGCWSWLVFFFNTKPLFCIHWTISSLHFHIYVFQHNGQWSITLGTWSWKLPWIKQPTVQLYDIVHLIQDRFLDNTLFNDQYYFFSLRRIFLAQFSHIWQVTSAHWIIYPLNDYHPNLC